MVRSHLPNRALTLLVSIPLLVAIAEVHDYLRLQLESERGEAFDRFEASAWEGLHDTITLDMRSTDWRETSGDAFLVAQARTRGASKPSPELERLSFAVEVHEGGSAFFSRTPSARPHPISVDRTESGISYPLGLIADPSGVSAVSFSVGIDEACLRSATGSNEWRVLAHSRMNQSVAMDAAFRIGMLDIAAGVLAAAVLVATLYFARRVATLGRPRDDADRIPLRLVSKSDVESGR